MIYTDELMQGNLVNMMGLVIKISNIFEMKNTYLPILLTPEWLLKFGFVENENKQFRLEDRLIVTRAEGLCDYGTGIHLKTVHQLQNFMYANTGKKLILQK